MAKTNRISPFVKQCFVTAAVCCNVIGHGAIVGFPAVILPQLHLPGSPVEFTTEQESWITSVMSISLLLGNFITPTVMDRLGRRAAHLLVAVPSAAGWFVMILFPSFVGLIIGRILHGLSLGLTLPLRSVLIGEFTSPKNRGAFLTTISLAQSTGVFAAHLLGSLLDWQTTALICAFFPFTSFVMTLYSPESPSYLAAKSKFDKCREVFRWLRGYDEEEELEEMIQAQMDKAMEITQKNLKEMLMTVKKKEFYKPILVMVHMNGILNFAGGATISANGNVILSLILGAGANINFWMVALDSQRIISNIAAVYVINKCKRRTMVFSVGSICVLSHLAISAYVYARAHGLLFYDAAWIPILLVNLQFFTVATGMVPLPFVIAGEIFPLQYRSIAGSISIISIAAFSFIVLKTFPGLTDSIGIQGTYAVYAAALTYFLIVVWVLLPETKGKTLQQIEEEIRGRPLKPEEVQERQSLHSDWVRKMSVMSAHSVKIEL